MDTPNRSCCSSPTQRSSGAVPRICLLRSRLAAGGHRHLSGGDSWARHPYALGRLACRCAVRPIERVGLGKFMVLLIGLNLIGLGRELRDAALRRVDQLAMSLPVETDRVQRAARRWLEGLPQHSGILPALAAADTRNLCLRSSFGADPCAARGDGCARADRRSSECRDHRGDLRLQWRSGRWLVRCAADTTGRNTAWNAAGMLRRWHCCGERP